MSSILFIAADPREFTGLLTHWDKVAPLHIPVHFARTGRWKSREVFAIANGAGADRAFAALLLAPKASAICNIGFCGALDETLEIGDVVVADEVATGPQRWPAMQPKHVPHADTVKVASIDHVAQTAAEKRNLRATGASIVEMESAGVARAAEDLYVPFYCIRAVSDLAGEDFANDFNAALTPDGTFSILRLLAGAVSSPQVKLKELLRLQKRTTLASQKLGDFLAATEF
jgi:adenosylhomocysteine nucleosidase